MVDEGSGTEADVDPKPRPRVQNAILLRQLHREWKECALCLSVGWEYDDAGDRCWIGLSLHHIRKHPRDDVRANLVMLCGDGVRGCHGKAEAHDPVVMKQFGEYFLRERPDVIEYWWEKLGSAAPEWFLRLHHVSML